MKKGIAVIVLGILALLLIGLTKPNYIDAPTKVIVRQGETLWEIVDREMTKANDERPIELVIYNTRQLNHIDAKKVGNLQAGEKLTIPVKAVKK